MALFAWDSSYSVSVKRCDEDHKKLFALINSLYEAMSAGKGAEKLQQVVSELDKYTKFHFSAEEKILEQTKYPHLGAHRLQHRQFEKKIEQFGQEVAGGKAGNAIAVATFLKDWLSKHIMQTDKLYSQHVNAAGVS